MLGIILCGGKSSRMGSDKGMLRLEAKTWAQTAIDKMTGINIPIKVSVNKDQYAGYESLFSKDQLIMDDETLQVKGPLLGLLTAHLRYPAEDLFVLACDMPLMEPFLLRDLYDRYLQQPAAEAYVYTNDDQPEPLCGIYTSKGLTAIVRMLKEGQLSKFSMKFMLDHLVVDTIAIMDEHKKYFRNFNAHAELNGL